MKFIVTDYDWSKLSESMSYNPARLHERLHETTVQELTELRAFLAFARPFALPVVITKQERPDFMCKLNQTNGIIGIEHTWAADARWEEAEKYMLSTRFPLFDTLSRNWFVGQPNIKGRDLGRYLKKCQKEIPNVRGWDPGQHAGAKADEVVWCIQKKSASLQDPSYSRCDQHWLLISDRLPFLFLSIEHFNRASSERLFEQTISHDRVFFQTQAFDRHKKVAVQLVMEWKASVWEPVSL